MGGHPWSYFTPYQNDIAAALQALREQEFQAGRYYYYPEEEVELKTPDDVLNTCSATGTRSIIDMLYVGDAPDNCTVVPLPSSELVKLFGTDKPTHEMVEQNDDFFEPIERGQGIYIIVYKDNNPNEIFFAGYSFD